MVSPGQKQWLQPRLSVKLTTPYLFLALTLVIGTVALVARGEADALTRSFDRQITDAGQRVADSVVRLEIDQLAAVRAIANLADLPPALAAGDSEAIGQLVLPYAVNQQIERVVVLDADGLARWAMRRTGPGPTDYAFSAADDYASWPLVADVLAGRADGRGDKFTGLAQEAGDLAIYTAGPIIVNERIAGAVLVGRSLDRLALGWREATLADVTLYDIGGAPLATSLGDTAPPPLPTAMAESAHAHAETPRRQLEIGSRSYAEVLLPLVVRGDMVLALVGATLPTGGVEARAATVASSILLIFAAGSAAIILTGTWIAQRIVTPIRRLVAAAQQVATGDLSPEVPVESRDEVGELSEAFNRMVGGLRDRERIRDVLGRFVSPTIAELVLQRPLDLSGELRTLSILFTDLRDFTKMTEEGDPAEVVRTLNQYFTVVVRAAEHHGGLVNKFGGDSTLVIFGLTGDDSPEASARAAIMAGLEICRVIGALNGERAGMGLEPINVGMGITTGPVIAGLIGAEQRMEYTVIGDAVNLSARIQALSQALGSDILISAATFGAIGDRAGLRVDDLGWHQVKGKQGEVHLYAVRGQEEPDAPAD